MDEHIDIHARKVFLYEVFSVPYFPLFGQNTESYGHLPLQERKKIVI